MLNFFGVQGKEFRQGPTLIAPLQSHFIFFLMFQGVADTATLKERANAEANAASSASSTEASTPASASTSFSTDKLMGALKNDAPEAAAATAEEAPALEVTVPNARS